MHGLTHPLPRLVAADTRDDAPGVIARPPRLYLAVLAGGVILDLLWPTAVRPDGVPAGAWYGGAAALIASGVGLIAAAVRAFGRAATPVETYRPTAALVESGVFERSRNPMYVALTLMYLGLAVAANNLWLLGLLLPLLALMRYGVVAREERYLEARFGERYRAYRSRVRRWL
jgi:protein-S-isoprenylcysteine O-methyltransferase Ste14